MQQAPQQGSEFCPDCGEFVDQLDEWTGFCFSCTPSTQSTQPTDRTPSRIERWLIKYADAIEFVMVTQRVSAKLAIAEVHVTYRAICIICNQPIKHGTHDRHFLCNSTPECRKARRRYKYLIYEKGYTKDAALAAITPKAQTPTGESNGNSSSA